MADFIRLNSKHNLKDLLRLVAASKQQVIYIALASTSPLWSEKALILIKRAERECGKKFVLVTRSRVAKIVAGKIGLASLSEEEVLTRSPKMRSGKSQDSLAWLAHRSADKPKSSASKRRFIFAVCILFALAAGFVTSNITLAGAEITVYTRLTEVDGNIDVFIGDNFGTENILNAVPLRQTFSAQARFPATGVLNQGEKAAGQVILSSVHPSTLTLRSDTTHFFTADGTRFRFAKNVSGLRPGVPQVLDVFAEAAGEAGNLTAGTRLELYNAVLGHQPQLIYGEVAAPGFSGGTSEEITVVSDTDISRARDELQNAVFEQAKERAKSLNAYYNLLPDLTKIQITDESFSAKLNDQAENFQANITAQVTALAVNEEELAQIVSAEVKKSLTAFQNFIGLQPGFTYTVRSEDVANESAALNVKFTAATSTVLDEHNVKVLLAGKTADEIKSILLTRPEIASVQVDLSPFWLTTTPDDLDRLTINFAVENTP